MLLSPQILIPNRAQVVTAGGGDAAATTAFLARLSDHTWDSAYRTLINGLVSDGVFAKLDGLYMLATQAQADARLNLVQNAFNLTENNSPTFAANQGYTGDGATTSLATGFTPGTSGGNYAQNSACFGIWTRLANSPSNGNISGMLGGAGPDVEAGISNNSFSAGGVSTGINQAFGSTEASGTGTGVGFAVGNRSASNAEQLYYNGSSLATATTASVALTNAVPLWFLARNFNGSNNQTSTEQIAAGVFGGSLTGTDHSNLYSRVQAFLHSVGAV